MGLVTLSQAEGAAEVAGEHVDLLNVGDQSLVDGLLVGSTAAVDLLLLFGWKRSTLGYLDTERGHFIRPCCSRYGMKRTE